jgi:hypothetical protein
MGTKSPGRGSSVWHCREIAGGVAVQHEAAEVVVKRGFAVSQACEGEIGERGLEDGAHRRSEAEQRVGAVDLGAEAAARGGGKQPGGSVVLVGGEAVEGDGGRGRGRGRSAEKQRRNLHVDAGKRTSM